MEGETPTPPRATRARTKAFAGSFFPNAAVAVRLLPLVFQPPVVSVLLPVWNGERFLASAIESILEQTFEELELIVVDDGSDDSSAAIARRFAERDPRVVLLRRAHQGVPSALNAGIAAARGRYIARMDADDISLPARLEKQLAYLDSHPDVVAVGSWVGVIDEDGGYIAERRFAMEHRQITASLLVGLTPFSHPTTVVRREVLLAVHGYDVDRHPSDDFDLWLRLSEIGKLANLPEALLLYRRHADAVGIRERKEQLAMSQAIVNEARKRRSLSPLRPRFLSPGTNDAARYHFECARFALLSGPRRAALYHAWASITFDPRWPEPYAALLACAVPKWLLRRIVEYSAFARALDRTVEGRGTSSTTPNDSSARAARP